MKKVVEKDMKITGLKRTDAQDRSLWRLDCKNPFNPARKNRFTPARKQARFQEDENMYQQSWNKWKMMILVRLQHINSFYLD